MTRDELTGAGARALHHLQGSECVIPEHGNALYDALPAALCDDCESAAVLTAVLPLVTAAIAEAIERADSARMVAWVESPDAWEYENALRVVDAARIVREWGMT